MPVALIVAIAASLGIHVAALFGPDFDLSGPAENEPLQAELRPQPLPPPAAAPEKPPAKPVTSAKAKRRPSPELKSPPVAPPPLASAETSAWALPRPGEAAVAEPAPVPPESGPAEVVESEPAPPPRLPARMEIEYRVDRGDREFMIGRASQSWEIDGSHYRLRSRSETTGLAWLLRSYTIDMESVGELTADGLRPEYFRLRRNGGEADETADFDWQAMTVRVAGGPPQALFAGSQDLLSFNYQLGYLSFPEGGSSLGVATGKRYRIHRVENLGDEEITVPAGTFRTQHLRAPGDNATELWLAYDYLRLPVKIRHVDNKGDSLVQVATRISLNSSLGPN